MIKFNELFYFISNYNPSERACSNNWYIYDSLNNTGFYLYTIKNVLKRINGGSRFIKINHIPVSKQNGSIDCGLFALGYALDLAMDIDSEIIDVRLMHVNKYTIHENGKQSVDSFLAANIISIINTPIWHLEV
ncbi:hypothetical protein BpHYR1_007799 [Brachionus plicatilis]|uniref:Ubiquitin-like protease family profile domain-containing protein n=1 Tax=Brachionus plicatilis TaxID=10195 RepID=A0A3M7PRX0_BRAPC|nr:hypothetical protein BpHYR1_007799 [Brachionus plicatilis]